MGVTLGKFIIRFFFNFLIFHFGPVPYNDGVNGMRYMCMFIMNPSNVQWFRFTLCEWRVSYDMGSLVGINGTRCTIRARGFDPSLFLGARKSTRSNEFGTSISILLDVRFNENFLGVHFNPDILGRPFQSNGVYFSHKFWASI